MNNQDIAGTIRKCDMCKLPKPELGEYVCVCNKCLWETCTDTPWDVKEIQISKKQIILGNEVNVTEINICLCGLEFYNDQDYQDHTRKYGGCFK